MNILFTMEILDLQNNTYCNRITVFQNNKKVDEERLVKVHGLELKVWKARIYLCLGWLI